MAVIVLFILLKLLFLPTTVQSLGQFSAQSHCDYFCRLLVDSGKPLPCQFDAKNGTVCDGYISHYVTIRRPVCHASVLLLPAVLDFDHPVLLWARPPGSSPYQAKSKYDLKSVLLSALLLSAGDIQPNPGPIANRTTSLSFGLLNINSALRKAATIHDIIADHDLSCLVLTETRLQADLHSAIKDDMAPTGFAVRHVHRSSTARHPLGGGLAFISHDSLTVTSHSLSSQLAPASFELLLARITSVQPSITVAAVYRPPDGSIPQFVDELSDVLGQVAAVNTDRLLLCGDVNCPASDSTSVNGELTELLDVHGLRQHVSVPTRSDPDHLLDILATDSVLSVSDVRVVETGASDHKLVVAAVGAVQSAPQKTVSVRYRNIRQIDIVDFEFRLRQSPLFTAPADTVDAYADQIQSVVTALLDDVAPLRCVRRRPAKAITRWLSDEAIISKRERRRSERRWKKTRLELDRVAYRRVCRQTNKLINASRADYFRQELSATTDCKRRWQIAKELLHSNKTKASNVYNNSVCDMFSDYFYSKIVSLKRAVATIATTLGPSLPDPLYVGPLLNTIPPIHPRTVLQIINSIKPKTSSADFIPTSLIKLCSTTFSEIVCHLANLSFSHGAFPQRYKSAFVTPLLKKPGLDPAIPSNYRPISNLNNISKILERLFLSTFQPHAISCSAFNPFQSAYRPGHSTETALLLTLNSIYSTADSGHSTLLVSLDLSAAFDTIDHNLLISRLRNSFGVSGPVLSWLQSYLHNRSQSVCVGSASSNSTSLDTGVPQGSVLGPVLFSTYISPISNLVASHNLQHQQYADDTQLFVAISSTDPSQSVSELESCLADLYCWLSHNGLCLNPSKSDAILFGTHQRLRSLSPITSINIAGSVVPLSDKITTLGVTLDRTLSFHSHVNNLCKSSYYHLRALRHIRSSLPDDICLGLATALIQSRLDYSNSLLYNTSASNLHKLQMVQNSLARTVTRSSFLVHSIQLMSNLHWLPIHKRVNFKIATLTYKAMSTQQPSYLHNLISYHQSIRVLRSSNQHLLHVPRTKTEFGRRAFSSAAPKIWNDIPLAIRCLPSLAIFKRHLKTHYFTSP
jgi:hypothetical protein